MKINFNKKNIIVIVILFLLLGFAIAKLIYFNSHYKTFVGDRISFLYPKKILIESPSINRLYKTYRIRKGYVTGSDGSYIYMNQ